MHKNFFYVLLFLHFFIFVYPQTTDSPEDFRKITTFYNNYFALEREAIHLHLNKTTFITPEKVWFKGYVLSRKTSKPSLKTTNVYAVLYDPKGIKLAQKLLFCSKGNFAGQFDIPESYETGDYYIHVYTNWMNNFIEDESYCRKIKIINSYQGDYKSNSELITNEIIVEFNPEGNQYIRGVSNSMVIRVKDCLGNYLKNAVGEIVDINDQVIKYININSLGCGKFEITPTTSSYFFRCQVNEKQIKAQLPNPSETGFATLVNNYIIENKTIIRISTNPKTIDEFLKKQLYLTINQDEKVIVHDFKLNKEKLIYEFIFSNENLSTGINTIRILDSTFNLHGERLIYQPPSLNFKSKLMHNVSKNNLSNYVGYTNFKEGNLSITIVPEGSKSQLFSQSIIYDFTCKPYIEEPIDNFNYFIMNPSRAKSFELDLLLISQKNLKYHWSAILNESPKEKFSFDTGIKITGKINTELKDHKQFKAKIFSISEGILVTTDINEKNEFTFDNLILTQSADVSLLTIKMPDLNPIESNIIAQTPFKNKPFLKGFKVPEVCKIEREIIPLSSENITTFKSNSILLNEVEIEKNPFKYKNVFGNRNLTAFKIDESYGNTNLLSFISSNGFKVTRTLRGNLVISSIKKPSIRDEGENTAVFIDGFELFDNSELSIYNMSDIDEIYLDNSYFLSMNGTFGVIKIYLKKKRNYLYQKNTANSYKVDGAFEAFVPFVNTKYQNFDTTVFKNYGIIQFVQYTLIDSNGSYFIPIPNIYEGNMKVIIEGITDEGEIIYEEKETSMK